MSKEVGLVQTLRPAQMVMDVYMDLILAHPAFCSVFRYSVVLYFSF